MKENTIKIGDYEVYTNADDLIEEMFNIIVEKGFLSREDADFEVWKIKERGSAGFIWSWVDSFGNTDHSDDMTYYYQDGKCYSHTIMIDDSRHNDNYHGLVFVIGTMDEDFYEYDAECDDTIPNPHEKFIGKNYYYDHGECIGYTLVDYYKCR